MGEKENKTLIFTETKRRADELARRMKRNGWPALCIHGDKSQPERDWTLGGIVTETVCKLLFASILTRNKIICMSHGVKT